jgi:hypothetical protein
LWQETADPLDGKNHFDCAEIGAANNALEVSEAQIAKKSQWLLMSRSISKACSSITNLYF